MLSLNVLYNYFDVPKKIFSDLYLVKFLDTLAEPFHVDITSLLCAKYIKFYICI